MVRRSGLGKGLGALIPPTPGSPPGLDAPRSASRQDPAEPVPAPQPVRRSKACPSLVDSIKAVGILQPVLVREVGPDEYELIAGERRFRAARRAGLQSIPALVHRPTTPRASRRRWWRTCTGRT